MGHVAVRVELRRDAKPAVGDPWLRKRQVAKIWGPTDPATVVEVIDHRSHTLGWGLVSPVSDIVVRMLSFGAERPPTTWLEDRLESAFAARVTYGFEQDGTTGYREVNSEGDGLPGLVIDRYEHDYVVQIATAAMAAREPAILAWLAARTSGRIHVSLPAAAAKREGFELGVRYEAGATAESSDRRDVLHFHEHRLAFKVPAPPSQKTGAYFDQRDNHRVVASLAKRHGGALLDLGCHVGGFALHARARGLDVVAMDQSDSALAFARDNERANALQGITWVRGDLFAPSSGALEGTFGTIVLDPPKIASTKRDIGRAITALQRVVERFHGRLEPRGHLVLCSCSHHIGRDALDAIMLRIDAIGYTRVAYLGASVDHPVAPGHVEGEYLRVNVYQRRG